MVPHATAKQLAYKSTNYTTHSAPNNGASHSFTHVIADDSSEQVTQRASVLGALYGVSIVDSNLSYAVSRAEQYPDVFSNGSYVRLLFKQRFHSY